MQLYSSRPTLGQNQSSPVSSARLKPYQSPNFDLTEAIDICQRIVSFIASNPTKTQGMSDYQYVVENLRLILNWAERQDRCSDHNNVISNQAE
jgi:hypothetical protein